MFVENRAENFETRMRRLIYGLRERLNASRNNLVICLMNSVAWSSSELRQKWEKCLCMQSWINTYFFLNRVMSAKWYLYIIAYSWFFHWMLLATVHCMHFLSISDMYFFSLFCVILHYHCIYYVYKYGALCISLHVLWKLAIKIIIVVVVIIIILLG